MSVSCVRSGEHAPLNKVVGMEFKLLSELTLVFGLSIFVIMACHRIKIPPILGFLITGVIAGPHALGLVNAAHEVELLAEIGVVLLLFTIGLELSMEELLDLRKPVFIGGGAQVLFTIVVVFLITVVFGASPGKALFYGFLAALSSTAIVLKILQENAQIETPQGRIVLSILIFQDVIIVPMMLIAPFLTGKGGGIGGAILLLLFKTVMVLAILYVAAKYVVPRVLTQVVRTRSREVFILATLVLCLAVALMTSYVGLSLSLGAFLAGLIISESDYSISAMEGIMPFKDVFTSLFFISVGMLLDVGFFVSNLPLVILLSAALLVGKTFLAGGAARLLGYPKRTALLVGLALCQVGEFSFILAKVGQNEGLLGMDQYQVFLAASILTMAVTPFLIKASPAIAHAAGRYAPSLRGKVETEYEKAEKGLQDHLIIVGFGHGGKALARTAKKSGIRYLILEMNPDTVRVKRQQGEPIYYGDAGQAAVLVHAGIRKAKVLAVVISDATSVRRVVAAARARNPELHIVARTRFVSEIDSLKELGADVVVSEEFEASIEIFSRVLLRYMVPRTVIETVVAQVRSQEYELLRTTETAGGPLCSLSSQFEGMEVSGVVVESGAPLDGVPLSESDLRRKHGLTVVAVQRGKDLYANPGSEFRLGAEDVAYLFGKMENIEGAGVLFKA